MPIAGLVLHSSRCGSTLLLRALGVWPGVVVVDEPPALDEALTAARRGGAVDGVRAVLAELGSRGERVVVKTDAWHVLALPLLAAAAPGTPHVFLHRHPAEILVSHARQPGSHTVPGLLDEAWFGPPRHVHPLPHAADVVASIFRAATRHVEPEGLVDHADLPSAISWVAARFGFDPDAVVADRLGTVLGQHAKRPHETYVDDTAAKRAATTAEIAALVADPVGPAYDGLLARARGRAA